MEVAVLLAVIILFMFAFGSHCSDSSVETKAKVKSAKKSRNEDEFWGHNTMDFNRGCNTFRDN